jgi:hypothetical protein
MMLSRFCTLLLLMVLLTTGARPTSSTAAFGQTTRQQLTLKDYSVVSEKEAVPRFNLHKLLDSYRTKEPSEYGSGTVRIYAGDLQVDGPLWMDFEKGIWVNPRHEGMIVTGNLEVSGNILNTNISYGPFLLVLGNVSTRNIVSGGAEFHIIGNADVKDAIVGVYNDGSLKIDGAVKARLVINNDHAIDLGTYSGPAFDPKRSVRSRFSGNWWGSELAKLSEFLVGEIKLTTDTVGFGDDTQFESVEIDEQLIPRLVKGLPILKPPAKNVPLRNE